MQNFPPMIPALAFAAVFFVLCAGLGRRLLLLVRLAPSSLNPLEMLLLETAAGVGFIQVVPIALGSFGALTPQTVRVATMTLAVALLPDAWNVMRRMSDLLMRLATHLRSWPVLLWATLLGIFLAVLLVHALFLGFTDDDGYHLSAPMRWLWDGSLSYLPTYTHTNAGLAFEMSYLIALAFDAVLGAKLLHYGTGVLALVAVMACSRRLGSLAGGAAAVSALMISTPILQAPFLFTVAYADFPVCLSMMVGVLLWLAWRETHESKLLWCIALFAGFTASFKFTALAVLPAWALLVAFELRQQGRRPVPGLIDLLKFGTIAIIPTLPWFARNWILTGNPLYPMASSFIPSLDWSAEQGLVFSKYIKLYSWGVASGSGLGESTRKLLLVATALVVAAGSGVIYWLVKDLKLRLLLGFAAVYVLICIALTGLLFRYWLPGAICVLLVILVAAAHAFRHALSQPALQYAPGIVLMMVALGVQASHEVQRDTFLRDLRVATGISLHETETLDDPAEQMWRYIQRDTEKDARILVAAFYQTHGASSFGCFRAQRYCLTTDSHLQTYIDFTDWDAFLRSVKKAGVDYVLISDQQFTHNRQGFSYRAGQNELPFCRRLVQSSGTLMFQADHYQIYRLDDQGARIPLR